jgi:hypothetical protein
MRNLKNILICSFLTITSLNCKEVYSPPSVKYNPFILVADGIIFSGNDSSIITLSRTKSLSDTASQVKELNARVSVEGKTGVEFPLTELGNGQYVAGELLMDNSQQYQLKIITSDGNEFRSVSFSMIFLIQFPLISNLRVAPMQIA